MSQISFRDVFDLPALSNVNDDIVDGLYDHDVEKPFILRFSQCKALHIHWRVWGIIRRPSQNIVKVIFCLRTTS